MTKTFQIGDYDVKANNIYYFNGKSTVDSLQSFMDSIKRKRRHFPDENICVALRGNGGVSGFLGLSIDHWLKDLMDDRLITLGFGRVKSSLAMNLMQMGAERYAVGDTTWFLYHRPVCRDRASGEIVSDPNIRKQFMPIILSRKSGKTCTQLWDEFSYPTDLSAIASKGAGFIDGIIDIPPLLYERLKSIQEPYYGFLPKTGWKGR